MESICKNASEYNALSAVALPILSIVGVPPSAGVFEVTSLYVLNCSLFCGNPIPITGKLQHGYRQNRFQFVH